MGFEATTRRHPERRRWSRVAGSLAALALAAGAIAHWAVSRDLPEVPAVESYRPPLPSEFFSGDGQRVGEFFVERRRVLAFDEIPTRLVNAFVAAEDKRFFRHRGIDWLATARAVVHTYVLRRRVQGGSTLTQQAARALLVKSEGFEKGTRRSWARKARELVLARRMERALTKEQILWLYLNDVFLGRASYGVQAAAQTYFRKDARDLTLAEAAFLGGLPQAPSRLSRTSNLDGARARRGYVLRRMFEDGMITAEERRDAEAASLGPLDREDELPDVAPDYVELARRTLVDRFGLERLLRGGLRVELTLDIEKQRAAVAALRSGIESADRRQGYEGPLAHVAGRDREALESRLARAWPEGSVGVDEPAVAIVEAVDDGAAIVRVRVGAAQGTLPVAGMRWARPPDRSRTRTVFRPSEVLAAGDVILVRRRQRADLEAHEARESWRLIPDAPLLLALEQIPKLQGALLSVEPFTGYVPAVVGGYDFEESEFDRAVQACRRPGSAFKPIVYSAAIDQLGYTPATLLDNAPMSFHDEEAGGPYSPPVPDDFPRRVTLRDALVYSLNVPAVRAAEALGVDRLVEWSRALGLGTRVARTLRSALGRSCTTLWDLANVYALFDRYGERRAATLVKRVLDRDGRLLEDHTHFADPWVPLSTRLAAGYGEAVRHRDRVMDERSAFQLVHLLVEVAARGSAAPASTVGRPVAGKTGTSADSLWFVGFTRDLLAGVWLGYDSSERLPGSWEDGGGAVLPIWLAYMRVALEGRPQPGFPVPDGIVFERIDPATGRRTGSPHRGLREPFKANDPG